MGWPVKRDRAEYMRQYRASLKQMIVSNGEAAAATEKLGDVIEAQVPGLLDRISELEAEVARLKRELAERASWVPMDTAYAYRHDADVSPSFGHSRPAPKPKR